jgi:ligand-binding sensor domain-containing protein
MRTLLLFLIVPVFVTTSSAQQFINWQNYTALKNVRDVVISDNGFWSAANGGAFRYNSIENDFITLHKSDGLNGISLTSVTIDNLDRAWFGGADGIIDIYEPGSDQFNVILDIYSSGQINRRINDLVASGDTIIVSSDFGVSLIDANTFLFFDTFFKFGDFTTNTRVNSTLKSGLFYVCTDEGIAIQKPGAVNLSAPESWNVYSTADGLPSDKTLKARFYQNNLIVSTDEGFSQFINNTWSSFIPNLAGVNIVDYQVSGDSILILAENVIYLYANSVLTELYNSSVNLLSLEFNNIFGIVCASADGSLFLDNQLAGEFLSPNAPPVNQFPSLSVDANSLLYSASGTDVTGVGYYTYDGEIWNHYNKSNTPELPANSIYFVNTINSTGYFGTWGSGFFERTEDGTITAYNSANTGMQGVDENPNFLVIAGLDKDSQENLWVLNYGAVNRMNLSTMTTNGDWYHFAVPAENNFYLELHDNLTVDIYDTKWYSCAQSSRQGLFYFNENKTYEDPSDDRSDYLTTVDGLNTNDIRDVVTDRRGDIWVATSLGVNIITNTSAIPTSGSSALRISSVFVLRQQSVNAIAVDPLNQKWIGTNEGLLLVNSDGSRLLTTFTAQNSALLSNIIRSIAIDENKGIVYVGTDEGLTSFETPYIKPLESFEELFVYPNPFNINDGSNLLTIDGLIREADIKVLKIDGTLVTQFSSPGGRTAYWDGRDDKGELVNSGVYIIVAFDLEGNNVVTGKVAVLRK